MKKTGQFDIIKIVSTFMVVILHYLNKSKGMGMDDSITANGVLTHIIESICIVACNLFVLVTAWFMADAKNIKIRKVINIILIILFYGCGIFGICVLTGITKINKESLEIFKTTIGNRWFVVIYTILYLLIPYINKLVHSLTKKDLRNLIIIMLIFFSVWPTVFTDTTVKDSGYGIINFVMLYLIAYYIKKYINYKEIKFYKIFLIWIISTAITTAFSYINGKAWNYNSIFVIIESVSLFLMIARIEINRSKLLSFMSSFSLSTYIIHANGFIIIKIFQDIFKSNHYSRTNLLIVNIVICTISIFAGCMIIETARRFLFKYTVDKVVDRISLFNIQIEI